ncbi:MAG: hypothetical protein BMS9Abin09_0628 [Gammaproteobacteria bacterium]|nr:MAG: hypothetical protein BMS9Abin09_0628 [Gammaproteobacteria bacterium]
MKKRSLDVRGLEPPEPLERILGELDLLQSDEQLDVTHWREPLLLYPILAEKAWQYKTEYDEKTRTYLISIWKDR